MNKIVAVTMVKNEADIIESMVRHTLSYADLLLIVDHQSTDETRKILELLKNEGLAIKIYSCEYIGHNQSEIMTEFLYRAIIDESADLVIPSDADEFILLENGSSKELRAIFQKLPINCSFSLPWIDFSLSNEDKNSNKYLLSRKCYRNISPNKLPKCIVGKDLVFKTNGHLKQGNHIFDTRNDRNNDWCGIERKGKILESIYVAHFPIRSKGQRVSKIVNGWLTNLVSFGRHSAYATTWKNDIQRLFNDEQDIYSVGMGEKMLIDLSKYANEAVLRYSSGVVDPLKNIVSLSEYIASSYAEQSVLQFRYGVTNIVIYDYNLSDLKATLESIYEQTYPYMEIYVVAHNDGEAEYLAQMIEHDDVIVCGDSAFEYINANMTGEYVQIIYSGDLLMKNKVLDQVVFLNKHGWWIVTSCAVKDKNEINMKHELKAPEVAHVGHVLQQCLLKCASNLGNVSNALFKRSVFEDISWMKILLERKAYFIFWMKILMDISDDLQTIASLKLPMVINKCNYTLEDKLANIDDWRQLLDGYRGSKYLSEYDYKRAIENLK